MAERELTPEEVAALGLERELSDEEARALGLETKSFRGHGASGSWGYEDPGVLNAIAAKLGQGFMKDGADEITGQAAKLLLKTTRQPTVRLREIAPGKKVWERYEAEPRGGQKGPDELAMDMREHVREKQHGAEQHYPKMSTALQIGGDVASDVAAAVAGVPVVNPAYQAITGGVRGYFGNDSDDAESKAASTALGSVLGYGFGKIPEAAAAISRTPVARAIAQSGAGDALRSIARWPGEALDRASISLGRRVLSGAKGLKAEEALPDAAVREAMDSGAIVPFGTTKGASQRLDKIRSAVGNEYADIIRELEEQGVQGPEAKELADKWMERYRAEWTEGAANKAVPRQFRKEASNVEAIMRPAPGVEGPATNRLRLSQAEGLKRDLQNQARYGKFEETQLNEAKREIASDVRGLIESEVRKAVQGGGTAKLRDVAARFEPVKGRLSRLINADQHAYEEANRMASRSPVSLYDAMAGMAGFGAGGGGFDGLAKGAGAALLAHIARSRGPSTGATAARGLSKLALGAVEKAPQVFGEFGAIIAGQKTPEARMAVAEDLAARYPAFAEMLWKFSADADPQASRQARATGAPGASY